MGRTGRNDFDRLWQLTFEAMESGGLFEDLRSQYVAYVDKRGLGYADHLKKRAEWYYYVHYCRLAGLLAPGLGARIVDWGGYYGQVTRLLNAMGFEQACNYLLYEPETYPELREQFALPTVKGLEANELNLDSGSVDLFISSGVLEHVQEDGEGDEKLILKEVLRVLKPGALFLIWNLPCRLSSSELLAALAGKWHHQRKFSSTEIRDLLHKSGFELVWQYKHKFLPGSLLSRLFKLTDPVRAARADDSLSRIWPFSIFSRDHLVLARKPDPK